MLWPFTVISYAMLPTDVTIETTVWLALSSNWTMSPVRRAS